MPNTYKVDSSSYIPGSAPDPVVTIIGSVDGIDVVVTTWFSAFQSAFASGGMPAVKALTAKLMLAQSIINQPPPAQTPAQLPIGTFTL